MLTVFLLLALVLQELENVDQRLHQLRTLVDDLKGGLMLIVRYRCFEDGVGLVECFDELGFEGGHGGD